jgi:hypothetical protein
MSETYREMCEKHRQLEQAKLAEERQEAVAADRQRKADEEAAEARKRQFDFERRINAEAAVMHPSQVLADLAAAGVTLSINDTGQLTCVPAGRLSHVQRAVLTDKRDQVLALLQQQRQEEII